MCRVCQRHPEIPGEPHGRCESCARAGRRAYRFRLRPEGAGLAVAAGEMSPRALKQALGEQLAAYEGQPSARPHLLGTSCDLVVAGKRLETVWISPALASRREQVLAALRSGARRTEAAW